MINVTSNGITLCKYLGWLNDLLDKSNLKFIWISNHIEGIETSVMGRVEYSIYFNSFNRRQRVELWEIVRNSFAFYSPEELTHNECVQALVKEAGHKKRYAEGTGIGFLRKKDIK